MEVKNKDINRCIHLPAPPQPLVSSYTGQSFQNAHNRADDLSCRNKYTPNIAPHAIPADGDAGEKRWKAGKRKRWKARKRKRWKAGNSRLSNLLPTGPSCRHPVFYGDPQPADRRELYGTHVSSAWECRCPVWACLRHQGPA